MKLLHGAVVAASGTLWFASGAGAQPSFWSFGERSRAFAVNPDGSHVLYQDPAGTLYRWAQSSGTATVLSAGLPFFTLDAVSADLSTTLGSVALGNRGTPARWRPGTGYERFFDQPGIGFALNGDGNAAAGVWLGTAVRAFRWTESSGLSLLPDLTPPAGTTIIGSEARQISRDGSIVAGYTDTTNPERFTRVPTVWRNGTPQALLYPPEASLAYTSYLSADGQRVVGANAPSDPGLPPVLARMLFWDAAGQYEAISLPDGWRNIDILGGTGDLSTVVGTLIRPGERRGFLWRRDLGFVLADDLLATIGVTRPDWEFTDIRSISDDGLTIVGTARLAIGNPFQEEIAWVATIPTPGAAALLTLAGLWTARRRGAAGAPNQSPEA
jgi:hypothetical protein